MMCARVFYDFNARAADVTTWRVPQVSLLIFLCFDFTELYVLQFVLKMPPELFQVQVDLFLLVT